MRGSRRVPGERRALADGSGAGRDLDDDHRRRAGEAAPPALRPDAPHRQVWGPTAYEFNIHRPKRANLSFAIGPHYCIGHFFARAQLAVAVQMLIERYPRLRLDPEHEPVYRGHEYRSPKTLRVLVD